MNTIDEDIENAGLKFTDRLEPKTLRAVNKLWRKREAGAERLYPYKETAEYCIRKARRLDHGYAKTVGEYAYFLDALASEYINS